MTAGDVATIAGAVVTLISAITAAVVALVNLKRGNVADGKLDHITMLTNSTLTAANKRIDELEGIVSRLLNDRTV